MTRRSRRRSPAARSRRRPRAEVIRGAVCLSTPHPAAEYPGLAVVRVGPLWPYAVICAERGQTVVARGGETAAGYETSAGGRASRFVLRRGDRARLVRTGLPHMLGEWRIERAGGEASPRADRRGG